jgi:Flp pilus assembly protein TadD
MARLTYTAVFGFLLLHDLGCSWPFHRSQPSNGSFATAPSSNLPPLLIGPEATGHVAPTELPPKQASVACLKTAQELDQNGKFPEAILLYEKARQQDPSLASATSRRLAVLYDLTGQFEKASGEYDALLKQSPKDAHLLNDLGYSYYSRGQFAQAERTLTEATQIDPKNKQIWLNLGLAITSQGRIDDGLNVFRRVCTEGEARSNVGFLLAAQGKTSEAIAQYRQALELEPGLQQARLALERLENPRPKKSPESHTDRSLVRAGSKDRRACAEDVPTIFELEERINKQQGESSGSLPPLTIPE